MVGIMPFDSEAFRRAMMYWEFYQKYPNVARSQEYLAQYFYWREVAIEREIARPAPYVLTVEQRARIAGL